MTIIKCEKLTIPSAHFNGESSLPPIAVQCSLRSFDNGFFLEEDDGLFLRYGEVESGYPYRYQDMYDRALEPVQYDAVVLENDNLKATFLPAFGGKLWSLIDKRRDRELLFANDVVRPCNLAVRNAWLSGGIEWNAGFRGHHPYTCSFLHTAQTRLEDGTPVLRFYYFERMRCAVVQMDFFLPRDSEMLYARIRITNPNDEVVPMYWWSNAAVEEKDGNRIIVPARQSYTAVAGEGQKFKVVKIDIPLRDGTDISYPSKNLSSKDYFWTVEPDARKYVCQLDAQGYGLCQTSTGRLKGRKLFVWGDSQGGHRWTNFLTADGKEGRYNEIQSGLACTQYECLPMPPHTVWEWLEGYGALQVCREKAHGDWKEAREAVEEGLDRLVTEERLERLLEETRAMARTAAPEKLFSMEGWGALEAYRRSRMGGSMMNDHLDFGHMGPQQLDWKRLLDEGTIGRHAPDEVPPSYQRQKEWLALLEQALEDRDKDNWYAQYLYGTAMIAEKSYEKAFVHLKRSLELENTPWGNYAMAVCYEKLGEGEKETEFMLAAYELRREDLSLSRELLRCLHEGEKSEQAVRMFEKAAATIRQDARCQLYYAYALARLGRVKEAEGILCGQDILVVPDVREGELTVTQLWYEIQERKGVAVIGQRPPRELDFRMTGDSDEEE